MTRFAVSCPGATIEQLQRASAAARATAEAAHVDPIAAANGYAAHIRWDDMGFPEDRAPTKAQGELMGVFINIEAAAFDSLTADGLPPSAVSRAGLGLRDTPDDLAQLLRFELGSWLSDDPNTGEYLHVIQHGGLSARARRVGAGEDSYLDVEVGVGIGHCVALAHFGQLMADDIMQPRIVGYARKWNRSLPEAPTAEQVKVTMYGVARAAWEFQRYQLDHEPSWVDAAALELGRHLT